MPSLRRCLDSTHVSDSRSYTVVTRGCALCKEMPNRKDLTDMPKGYSQTVRRAMVTDDHYGVMRAASPKRLDNYLRPGHFRHLCEKHSSARIWDQCPLQSISHAAVWIPICFYRENNGLREHIKAGISVPRRGNRLGSRNSKWRKSALHRWGFLGTLTGGRT